MNSECWLPTQLIFKSNLRPRKFNCFPSDYFAQVSTTQIPKVNFHFDLCGNEVSALYLLVNNDPWRDSRIISLVVYLCVCAWDGVRLPRMTQNQLQNVYKW